MSKLHYRHLREFYCYGEQWHFKTIFPQLDPHLPNSEWFLVGTANLLVVLLAGIKIIVDCIDSFRASDTAHGTVNIIHLLANYKRYHFPITTPVGMF